MHKAVNPRRSIPAVSKVLEALGPIDLPRPTIVDTIRRHLAALRKSKANAPFEALVESLGLELEQHRRRPKLAGAARNQRHASSQIH